MSGSLSTDKDMVQVPPSSTTFRLYTQSQLRIMIGLGSTVVVLILLLVCIVLPFWFSLYRSQSSLAPPFQRRLFKVTKSDIIALNERHKHSQVVDVGEPQWAPITYGYDVKGLKLKFVQFPPIFPMLFRAVIRCGGLAMDDIYDNAPGGHKNAGRSDPIFIAFLGKDQKAKQKAADTVADWCADQKQSSSTAYQAADLVHTFLIEMKTTGAPLWPIDELTSYNLDDKVPTTTVFGVSQYYLTMGMNRFHFATIYHIVQHLRHAVAEAKKRNVYRSDNLGSLFARSIFQVRATEPEALKAETKSHALLMSWLLPEEMPHNNETFKLLDKWAMLPQSMLFSFSILKSTALPAPAPPKAGVMYTDLMGYEIWPNQLSFDAQIISKIKKNSVVKGQEPEDLDDAAAPGLHRLSDLSEPIYANKPESVYANIPTDRQESPYAKEIPAADLEKQLAKESPYGSKIPADQVEKQHGTAPAHVSVGKERVVGKPK